MERSDYRQASQATWEAMARGWERWRSQLEEDVAPLREWMIQALSPKPGDVVLELAAGAGDTGFEVAKLLGTEGRLISSDFAAEMVEAARRRGIELGLENVAYCVIDAESIELDDDSMDGVLCRWGYMLMADPATALRETRRVLRDGKRLSFSVWGSPERNPWAAIPAAAMVIHGHMPPPEAGAPGIFAMGEAGRIRELVTGAGFENPEIEEVAVEYPYNDFDAYWRFIRQLAGALAMVIETLSDDQREAVRETIRAEIEPYRAGDGYRLPGLALNAVTS
jgi:ubiquinone/menaquinone biosynthesis C-methylase UbiE